VRTFWGATLGAAIAAAAALSPLAAQELAPSIATGTPAPTPTPTPLRLDIDRHVSELLARHGTTGLPRFEETIEVVERAQPALDDLLRGRDLACGPTAGGPPPVSDLNAYRGATIPVHADFLAVGKLLWKGLSRLRHPKPRWFLYRVRREDAVRFVLREGELPTAQRYAAAGTTWEELARFHDRDGAADALRRLERGFATAERRSNGDPLPPWVATTCRPPGFR
jgi:hypothetical protein